MRSRSVATALAAFIAGLTAATALHRRAGRRLPSPAVPAAATTVPAAAPTRPAVEPVPARDGVVLPFLRPAVPATAVQQPTAPARCGDSGGRTKAGTPCAARAAAHGRCHHHRLAA